MAVTGGVEPPQEYFTRQVSTLLPYR